MSGLEDGISKVFVCVCVFEGVYMCTCMFEGGWVGDVFVYNVYLCAGIMILCICHHYVYVADLIEE